MDAAPGVFGLGMPRLVGVEFEESVFPVVDLVGAVTGVWGAAVVCARAAPVIVRVIAVAIRIARKASSQITAKMKHSVPLLALQTASAAISRLLPLRMRAQLVSPAWRSLTSSNARRGCKRAWTCLVARLMDGRLRGRRRQRNVGRSE